MDTIKVNHSDEHGNDHVVINRADYDPAKHTPFDDESKAAADAEIANRERFADLEAKHQYEANRGVPTSSAPGASGRNPSGTFSEPTPTDIRYPNKDETEFENNHGAFVGKSASQMRAARGIEDAPGGLNPEAHAEKVEARAAVADAAAREASASEDARKAAATGEASVSKGPRGLWFVSYPNGTRSKGYATEEEARDNMVAPQGDAGADTSKA